MTMIVADTGRSLDENIQHRVSTNYLVPRYELRWVAGARGKPAINADITFVTDQDFEVQGVSAVSASTSFDAEGGIRLTTAGADGDEVILRPHLDANQSAWNLVNWGTENAVEWECYVKTGPSIVNNIVWAGLKLTSTEVESFDPDQVFLRYEDGVNGGKWQAIASIGGVDTVMDTDVLVEAATRYTLGVKISAVDPNSPTGPSGRRATFYVNGTPIFTTEALTDAVNLVPFLGVAADGAAGAKQLVTYGQTIARNPQ
jgi:hypothetical protein